MPRNQRRVGAIRQRRSVTFAYGAISSVLLIVVATVALVLAPPSPPSVAEFAPNPETQIDDAPPSQSSRFGVGDGSCAAGQLGCEASPAATVTTTTAGPDTKEAARPGIVKARVRRCVGDPPRQIEDPQSPACVNYWEGDNGGAISRGVTRDEIRVALPRLETRGGLLNLWAEFFNRRFEFYGRKIRLVPYSPPEPSDSPQAQRAAAVAVDEEVDAFASLLAPTPGPEFYSELATRKIVGIENTPMSLTETDLRRWHPYVWTYAPALDRFGADQAEWICRGLAGQPARFGGPDVVARTRTFALITQQSPLYSPPGPPSTSALVGGLRRCGAPFARVVEVSKRHSDSPGADEAALADVRTAGATSILCYCDMNRLTDFQQLASSGAYLPEWLLAPFWGVDNDLSGQRMAPEHRAHSFGLTARNRPNVISAWPFYWAAREVDTSYGWSRGTNTDRQELNQAYEAMLLLASGIQGAGPNLSPATFAAGLSRTNFPNPGAAAAPYWQATVGFPDGEHAMVRDIAAIWFDERQESNDVIGAGAFCYVGRGSRWSLGHWPDAELPYLDRDDPCR